MLKKLFFVLSFFLLSFPVTAANPSSVIINEIAWMGSASSSAAEWIELFNKTNSPVNLNGWILKSADGKPNIGLTGIIPAGSFYLLERKDDTAVPNIKADQIYKYKNVLGNGGEKLEIYDNLGNLTDSADFSSSWTAGDNKTKQTMERSGNNWQTSQNPGGTPKAKNSVDNIEPATELKIKKLKPNPKPIIYPSGIIINEIMPSPDGPDEEKEWIELFNKNNFVADISGWKIKDAIGVSTGYIFPEKTKIKAKSFLILTRPKSKIILNNGGDGLELSRPDGKIINKISYKKAPRQESYSRTAGGWKWSSTPTPNGKNIIPAAKKPTLPKKKKKINSSSKPKIEKGIAAAAYPFLKNNNKNNPIKLPVFLPALALAVFSGIMILLLKRKMKSNKSINSEQ